MDERRSQGESGHRRMVIPVVGGGLLLFFQAEDGIRDIGVTGVQTCALPILCRTRFGERGIEALLVLAAVVSIGVTVGIVLSLFQPTVKFLTEVDVVEFFTGTAWTPTFANPQYGVLPLVVATLVTTVIAIAIALPLGLGSAIYLSEYATPRARKALKPLLEILARS